MAARPPVHPAVYLSDVVLPTLSEFLDAPTDQRRAYLACIVTIHLVDYVSRFLPRAKQGDVPTAIRNDGSFSAEALAIVQGIGNGTKHGGPDRKAQFQFAIGELRERYAFGFGIRAMREFR